MKRAATFLAAGVLLLLAGCTTSDDPRQGGLFGGLAGLFGGGYDQRITDEKAALAAEESRYQEAAAGSGELARSVEEREAEAERLKREVASLRADIDGLGAEIVALQDEEHLTRHQVQTMEADVAALLEDIDRVEAERKAHDQATALGADADQDTDPAEFGEPAKDEVSDLRAYINRLQEAVDALKATRARRAAED